MNNSLKKSKRGKTRAIVWFILFCAFIALQFMRPEIPNPPVTGEPSAPEEVKAILRKSCYNCHSNDTRLSWYDQIVPVYWQVRNHIIDGRAVLNFSEWDKQAPADQLAKIWESVNQVIAGAMPLSEYTFVHRDARITSEEMQTLKRFVAGLPVPQASDSQKLATLKEQLQQEKGFQQRKEIPVALNGISFIPDYKNWQPISSTERYDNGTLRVIVGNDVAIKAISDMNMNPWPEGTIFGKITWDALKDSSGIIRTGAFKQVEFMIRDSKKYNETRNWGFARFRTQAMQPYGKTVLFASECVNCHQPMKDNDFVFTIPFQSSFNSRGFNLVGSSVNSKDSSMSVLYSKKGLVTRVTWQQKPDEHWFGAIVPGKLLSVETASEPSALEFSVLP